MNENQSNPTAAETTAQESTQTTQTPAAQPAERTFTQADVDRMIADRLSRERRQHQQDIENARTEARTEAEQLAEGMGSVASPIEIVVVDESFVRSDVVHPVIEGVARTDAREECHRVAVDVPVAEVHHRRPNLLARVRDHLHVERGGLHFRRRR